VERGDRLAVLNCAHILLCERTELRTHINTLNHFKSRKFSMYMDTVQHAIFRVALFCDIRVNMSVRKNMSSLKN
jgi:hypothetical protein